MLVSWTDTASLHLVRIFDYISQDSPFYARRMVDRLTRRSDGLAEFPYSGRKVPEYDRDHLREIIEGPYRLIYLILEDRIDVIAVVHGAQLLPPLDLEGPPPHSD